MRIQVLTVPDCPNAPVVAERLDAALGEREAAVEFVEVTDTAQAERLGMTGSPTVLLDGVDPFAVPGAPASVSCRLYRDAEGRVGGAPSVADLQRALARAGLPVTPVTEVAVLGDVDVLDPIGRAGRGRPAPAEGALRAVQQAVLRHFARTGTAPAAADVEDAAAAAGRGTAQVLRELAELDFLTLDERGAIRAAYPFSAAETRHRVQLADGVEVWSMCAIDALGIAPMLGQEIRIASTDPTSGASITVTGTSGALVWEPASAVVFVGRRCCDGPAESVCCDVLNFFTDTANATAWAATHLDITGQVVDQQQAEQLGAQIFGHLLDATAPSG